MAKSPYIKSRGRNANGAWIIWSDGAVECFGSGGSQSGFARVIYPVALPAVSRHISIAERVRTDGGPSINHIHVSTIIDESVSNTGFDARCQMYNGSVSANAFSWRVYCAPV